ncbi:ABC transporter substrate-binding protein [Sphaerisporangium aureirubrum]|uniref:ABC transporter substrate-binding protein n=1 Tax=Sphaerisporangium aureirubrum TaxID=1544736 RepID=A0ABW1NW59_9ACTN
MLGGGVVGARGLEDVVPPRGFHYLVGEIDAVVARRPRERRFWLVRRDRRLPALLFERGTAGATRLIEYYAGRLIGPARRNSTWLVPHVMVDDEDAGGPDPRIALIEHVATTLQSRMPPRSGPLTLPRYRACRVILGFPATPGEDRKVQFRKLRDDLYKDLCERRSWIPAFKEVATGVGEGLTGGWGQLLLRAITMLLPRGAYGLWLRAWGLRWTGGQLDVSGRDHLGTALDVAKNGRARDRDPDLPPRMLLAALLHDLRRAARPTLVWYRRPRRRWPFVLLLRAVGEAGTPTRRLLDLYADLALTKVHGPLLVLGALTGEPPSYAVRVAVAADPEAERPTDLADRVHDLYHRAPGDLTAEGVYVAPLPAKDDDGVARQTLERRVTVPVRSTTGMDVVWPFLTVLLLALPAWLGFQFFGPSFRPSCVEAPDGEIVGIIDDVKCLDGVTGTGVDELRALQKMVAEQNGKIEGKVHRTVVFLAPLSVKDRSGTSKPNGLALLRGAITAQTRLNSDEGQEGTHRMPLRLLIANTGEKFAYGVAGPNVTQQIIDRAEEDGVAAVIGLTQSRPESLAAAQALSAAEIPVVAAGVTGSRMSDGDAPARYFQVSPPNSRIAGMMAAFAARSPDLRSRTGPDPGGRGRTAVVVFDPDDDFFSDDLKEKFRERYKAGRVEPIEYREGPRLGTRTVDVARRVCEKVRQSGGFVVYAARSAVMADLFDGMRKDVRCVRGGQIAVLSESTSTRFLEHPERMDDYPFLRLFLVLFNDPNAVAGGGGGGFRQFISEFHGVFGDKAPHLEAAGGYDAFNVVSTAVNAADSLDTDGRFGSNEVYTQLANPRVINELPGATGVLTLDNDHRSPPGKAVYVVEDQPGGVLVVRLACGNLADQPAATTWGTPRAVFPCPADG